MDASACGWSQELTKPLHLVTPPWHMAQAALSIPQVWEAWLASWVLSSTGARGYWDQEDQEHTDGSQSVGSVFPSSPGQALGLART